MGIRLSFSMVKVVLIGVGVCCPVWADFIPSLSYPLDKSSIESAAAQVSANIDKAQAALNDLEHAKNLQVQRFDAIAMGSDVADNRVRSQFLYLKALTILVWSKHDFKPVFDRLSKEVQAWRLWQVEDLSRGVRSDDPVASWKAIQDKFSWLDRYFSIQDSSQFSDVRLAAAIFNFAVPIFSENEKDASAGIMIDSGRREAVRELVERDLREFGSLFVSLNPLFSSAQSGWHNHVPFWRQIWGRDRVLDFYFENGLPMCGEQYQPAPVGFSCLPEASVSPYYGAFLDAPTLIKLLSGGVYIVIKDSYARAFVSGAAELLGMTVLRDELMDPVIKGTTLYLRQSHRMVSTRNQARRCSQFVQDLANRNPQ